MLVGDIGGTSYAAYRARRWCSNRAQVIFSGVILAGSEAQALVALPEKRFARPCAIDQNIGGLVGTIFANLDIVQIDIAELQALELNAPALVVADGADVFHPQSKLGASHHGAGTCPPGLRISRSNATLPA